MAARQSSKLEAGVRLSLPVLDETTLLHDVAAAWQTLNLLALVRIQVKQLDFKEFPMGVFRKHKAKNYSIDEAKREVRHAMRAVRELAGAVDENELQKLLYTWAEWEELVARLENRNDSDVI